MPDTSTELGSVGTKVEAALVYSVAVDIIAVGVTVVVDVMVGFGVAVDGADGPFAGTCNGMAKVVAGAITVAVVEDMTVELLISDFSLVVVLPCLTERLETELPDLPVGLLLT